MRDDQLLNLVRMAGEAEELDRSANLVLTEAPAARPQRFWAPLVAFSSVAAMLTLALVMWPKAPVSPLTPGPIVVKPIETGVSPEIVPVKQETVVADACQPSGPMLLAVFHQTDERCDCVVWMEGAFVETDIRRLGSADLIEAAWTNRCAETSDLVLVVAMDGPRDQLPADAEAALELAASLSIPRAWCGENPGCYEESASGFLAPSVMVVAETMAISSK